MKKIDFGQLLAIVANFGVLVGILLLVYELHQNRETAQSQTRNSVAEMLISVLALEISDPGLADIQVKAQAGDSMTPQEQLRFQRLQSAYWRYRENVHYQYRNGLYTEDEYRALREVWLNDLNTEPYRSIYCNRRDRSPTVFTAELDALMELPCE